VRVEVDGLQPRRQVVGSAPQTFVPTAIESKVPFNEAGEVGARKET
jgi:hypothetical protein